MPLFSHGSATLCLPKTPSALVRASSAQFADRGRSGCAGLLGAGGGRAMMSPLAGASGHGPTLAPRRDRPPPRRGITPAQPRAATHCPVGPGPGVATGPEYETFYNAHRPHQGIANARPLQSLPEPITDLDHLARLDIRR